MEALDEDRKAILKQLRLWAVIVIILDIVAGVVGVNPAVMAFNVLYLLTTLAMIQWRLKQC